MALSLILRGTSLTAERMETNAVVTLERGGDAFSIPAIPLRLKPRIPGAGEATFRELAAKAKANCPLSRLFKAEITLDAQLV